MHICRFSLLCSSSDSVIDSLGDASRISFTTQEELPVISDALIISRGLDPFVIVQPVTRQAYAALAPFPASETGAIRIHVDEMDSPMGPVAALDNAGLSTVTMG
jgi:hypothetical protein